VRGAQAWPDPHALLSLFSTHRRPFGGVDQTRTPTRVFVLGVNERRVTLYSQQCRALNLVWLLHETGVLEPGKGAVAVVGAGGSGLTAAAAAACKGHEVLLLNDVAERMPLQRFARHRWLHPRIFDWPAAGWWRDRAGLPLLDWKAGSADEVRLQILSAFDRAPWRWRVECVPRAQRIKVIPAGVGGGSATIAWSSDGDATRVKPVSAVLLAVGFGVERHDGLVLPPLHRDSYWDDPGRRWASPGRVLISGGSDGGLTEVLHAALGERFAQRDIREMAGAHALRVVKIGVSDADRRNMPHLGH